VNQNNTTELNAYGSGWRRNLKLGAIAAAMAACSIGAVRADTPNQVPDTTLSWHGITLYGIIDLGLQYETHGAPFSDYHPATSENIVNKNSRQSVTGLTSSNLSQSRIGLQGVEPIPGGDFSAVFKVETFFNPSNGNISDALHDQVKNNGRGIGEQSTDIDSSVAGQAFQTAYAGVSSKTFGTLTFGRQVTPLGDGVAKYDPNYGSQAFSLIGMSGTYAGGGDTVDKRLDDSLKYSLTVADIVRFGLLYKFSQSNGGANTAFQANIGGDYAGLSVDAYYSKVNDAVTTSSLSAAQVDGGSTVCPAVIPAGTSCAPGSTSNSLSAVASDNTTFSFMGSYTMSVFKFLAGYEHVKYANPDHPVTAIYNDIGGYNLVIINNAAFPQDKILQVYWAGIRYTALPGLDLVGAFYGYHQNTYGTAANNAKCGTVTGPGIPGTCSGHFEAFSFDAVYAFTKRFDGYAGAMYSAVYDGVASGYTFQRNNINPTIGVRYKF
jgi:predicted porin